MAHTSNNSQKLAAQLFEAVLSGNESQIKKLVKLGADPNYHVGTLVNGILGNELQIKTAHQLAHNLSQKNVLNMFSKRRKRLKKCTAVGTRLRNRKTDNETAKKETIHPKTNISSPPNDIGANTEGYVYILNYSSFKDKSNLNNKSLDKEAKSLLDSFKRIGYSGTLHSSLTEEETKEFLHNVKGCCKLNKGRCVIFIICGYAPYHTSVFTSDWKLFQFNEVISRITDSRNPYLNHLSKLFIFYTNRWLVRVCDLSPGTSNGGIDYKPNEQSTIASLYFESIWPKSSSSSPNNPSSLSMAVCRNIGSHRDCNNLTELSRKLQTAVYQS